MGIFNWWKKLWSEDSGGAQYSRERDLDIAHTHTDVSAADDATNENGFCTNPANGNPMIDGMGGIDTEGNTFGMDSSFDDVFNDDMFS